MGLEAPIRQAGLTLEKGRYMLFVESLAGKEIRRVPDAELGMQGDALAKITPCTWCQCAQDELEPILANAAKAYGATLLFNTELISFSQDESSVNLLVKDRGTEEQWQLQAEYLLGADGAKSPVREALHIPFTGRGTLEHFVNIYFRADLSRLVADRWFGICFVENPEFEGIFLAVNNSDRWLLNVQDAVYGHQTPDSYLGRAVDCIRKAVGRADLQPEVISILPWEAAGRVAEQFSDVVFFWRVMPRTSCLQPVDLA